MSNEKAEKAPAPKEPKEPKFGRVREGLTEEQILEQRTKLTADEVPDGYVKLAEVSNACRAAGIPVSKLVRATGGDRAMNPPADPIFQVVYVGRTRYLPGDVMTKGLEMLGNAEFLKTKRKRKAKEDGDEGTGPVRDSKKRVVRPKA